ncbi:MAG TPA: aldehyde dehydrogenase family protein, partial [Candidatus Limnocylindrales bacterium]|nr:aldehyde dehydrogenase family protein [Candidatus Limnocylindrales bacterium]
MATRTPANPPVEPRSTIGSGAVSRVERAPTSWGLGDGAAIPWEYAPAPESRDVVTLKERYGLFIGGKDVAASDGETFVTVNPATEEPLAVVARATAADMDRAVRAARSAFRRSWSTLSGRERA